MKQNELKLYLDTLVSRYNSTSFIVNDPISIPKQFVVKQDIEISAFWTAMLAWGRRSTIISKATQVITLMDRSPYQFIKNHQESDRKPFLQFKHRTFQPEDALYFLHFFQRIYQQYDTLEDAFLIEGENKGVEAGLTHFYNLFTQDEWLPQHTRKHLSTPAKNSACKRLNMFFRWMVRRDDAKVDFGIWEKFYAKDLFIPLDVHVGKVSRSLGLLQRPSNDWKAVLELTDNLRKMDRSDPVKYDYALFSLGVDGIMV